MSALTEIKYVALLATQMTENDAKVCLQEAKRLFPQVKQWHILVYNKMKLAKEEETRKQEGMEFVRFTKKNLTFWGTRIKTSVLKPYIDLPTDILIALNTENIEVFSSLIKSINASFKICSSEIEKQNAFNVFLPSKDNQSFGLMTSVKSFFENIEKYE